MSAEYLPATAGAGPEIVLLHGWANNREVWRPLLARLRGWANVTLLDIPGLAPGMCRGGSSKGVSEDVGARCPKNRGTLPAGDRSGSEFPPDERLQGTLEALLAHCPPGALLMGWSLGGQLASKLALTYPERFVALISIASNPRFTGAENWPGMDPETLAGFRRAARENPAATLRRFDALQAGGSPRARALMREVAATRPPGVGELPQAGLRWLAELDTRPALRSLALPQLHLLAGDDALVPASTAATLRTLLAETPSASVEVVPGGAHLLPLERPDTLAERLYDFCAHHGLLSPAPPPSSPLDKRDVAASFSRAATGYDSVARLQRDVGLALLEHGGPPEGEVGELLDLGSGTGYFCGALQARYPGANYSGLDIAEGMARYARAHYPAQRQWLVADAEALPLAAESMDFIFSSLAIQWCLSPAALFAELARVLRPGGRCVFTTLGPATLHELRSAWAAVDDHQHVNEFLPAAALAQAAERLPGVGLRLTTRAFRMDYDSVRELLLELKTLGAHNVNQRRPGGLTSPGALRGMMAAYEQFREAGRLPASYEVIFGELEKR